MIPDAPLDDLLMQARALRVTFPLRAGLEVLALDDFHLDLVAGEIVALIGGRASGKTTALRALFGKQTPQAGSCRYGELAPRTPTHLLDHPDVQLLPDEPVAAFDPGSTPLEAVQEALTMRLKGWPAREARDHAAAWLARVGVPRQAWHQSCATLGAGDRQRLLLACALAAQPRILGVDATFAALDASALAQVCNVLLDLRAEQRISVVVASPQPDWVRALVDRFLVLYSGVTVERAPVSALDRGGAHPYTRALSQSQARLRAPQRHLRLVLESAMAAPAARVAGCQFHPRCPRAVPGICDVRPPPLTAVDEGHDVACFYPHL